MLQALASRFRDLVFIRSHAYAILLGVFLLILSIPLCLRNKPGDWETAYLPAAKRLAAGGELFEQAFVYPPINAWLALPFVGLPRLAVRILWFALNALAVTVFLRQAWKLSGGRRLAFHQANSFPHLATVPSRGEAFLFREHLIFWLGLLCGIYYVLDAFTNQQTDLILAALVLVGCRALTRERDIQGGLFLGLAAAIKCTPLLASAYLLWKRRWKGALLIPAVAVGINLLPDVTHPPSTGEPRLAQWGRALLLPMAGSQHYYGTWACDIFNNHSIAGFCNRLLIEGTGFQVGPQTLKCVTFTVLFLLLSTALVCSWRAVKDREFSLRSPLELSLLLILMLLLSPQSSKPHFCTLLLPGFCLARAALDRSSRLLLIFLASAIVCGLVSNKDLIGGSVYDWVVWHGSITLSTVLLYAGCCVALVTRSGTAGAVERPVKPEIRALARAA